MVKELDFCTITFHKNYAVCTVNEGETITNEKSDIQIDVVLNHFKKKPFVYITHRIHSYAVDPTIYFLSSKIKNLIGLAVVTSNNTKVSRNIEIEKLFCKKPFETFTDMQDALNWTKKLIPIG